MTISASLLNNIPAAVRLARMEALVEASLQLNRASGLNDILQSILELASAQLECERATVFLRDARTGKLHARRMTNADLMEGADDIDRGTNERSDSTSKESLEIVLERGQGIAGYVAETGESLFLNDVQQDPRFDSSTDRRTGYVTRTMLCVPLRNPEGDLRGALQVINHRQGLFSPDDLAYLEAFATLAAVAVEREQLAQESVRARLLSTELELAHSIQQRLLPPAGTLSLPPPYVAWGISQPCYSVGGDAYDVVQLADGDCAFWVADVSGKGIGAALLMASLQIELRTLIHTEPDLARFATELNRRISAIAPSGTYATLFLGVLSAQSQRLRYVNAGHLSPVWMLPGEATDTSQTSSASRLSGTSSAACCTQGGMPIGLMPSTLYEAGEVSFPKKARLVVFSDGLTDAENIAGVSYDEHGAQASIARINPSAAVAEIGQRTLDDLDHFRIGAPAKDDTTLLVIGLD